MTLPRDPHGETLSRWAAEDPEAMLALLLDPVRQLTLRRALEDLRPGLNPELLEPRSGSHG